MVSEKVESGKAVEGKKGQSGGVVGGKIVVGDVVCNERMAAGTEKNGGEVTRTGRVVTKVVVPSIINGSVGGVQKSLAPHVMKVNVPDAAECVKRFVIIYRLVPEDVNWAREGVVATVRNGESIPLIQQRILDAGFENPEIIPMGADKVYLRSSDVVDVNSLLSGAADFFKAFFNVIESWNGKYGKFERGTWIRLYGIPLQAWNEFFLKLCAFDFGHMMKVDSCTVDRDQLDYARVLLATTSLKFFNDSINILVDDMLVNIKIVEEWGFAIGEDVCLFENENESESRYEGSEKGDDHANCLVDKDIDNVVNDLAEDWVEDNQLKGKVASDHDAHGGEDVIQSKHMLVTLNNATTDASLSNDASFTPSVDKINTAKVCNVPVCASSDDKK